MAQLTLDVLQSGHDVGVVLVRFARSLVLIKRAIGLQNTLFHAVEAIEPLAMDDGQELLTERIFVNNTVGDQNLSVPSIRRSALGEL